MRLPAFTACRASWTTASRRFSLPLQTRLQSTRVAHAAKMSDTRDYNAAITALNSLQSNFSIVDAIRKSGRDMMNKNAIPEMQQLCRHIGYEPSDLNRLNAIHIAGTNGKGSTSAFISSILCQYLAPTTNTSTSNPASRPARLHKIGLYTSPHLRSVRERIQINGEPLSEQLFARYFFEVWDRLESSNATKPVYFRYLTLMALHTYMSEGVDTAVIECGIGGEYDSTNILVAPSVAAVTSLAIDHTALLGNTIEDIAWHKAGIFKPAQASRSVYTVDSQLPSAMDVLRSRARDNGLELRAVPRRADIEHGAVKLGLAADFQKENASIAVAVAAAHLRVLGFSDSEAIPEAIPDPTADPATARPLPPPFIRGLEAVQWGGRCEVRRQGTITWHLDGGHTIDSIRLAAAWFAGLIGASFSTASPPAPSPAAPDPPPRAQQRRQKRVLLFNQQTRDAAALATALHAALREALPPPPQPGAPLFDLALFSTNVTFAPQGSAAGAYKPDLVSINVSATDVAKLTVQRGLAEVWGGLDDGCEVAVKGTIEEAVGMARGLADGDGVDGEQDEVVVLVIGSLHLVGGVLEVLESR